MDAEARLYADLDALGIAYDVVEHEAVYTVAESDRLYAVIPGTHIKNLFLKDKDGRFWLVTVPSDMRVALKHLPEAVGCKRVSFASAEDMERLIGVTPGSVTPVGAINDAGGEVTVVLDASLACAGRINVHPLRNTATMGLDGLDLIRALESWNHPPTIAAIPALETA
jgi:Ala-tRNA(Pro) deacylase